MRPRLPTRLKLSSLVFLQFFAAGMSSPVMSLYLVDCLHFSGRQAGLILSMGGLATILSMVAGAVLANRLLSVERLLCASHVIAAASLLLLSLSTAAGQVFLLYGIYTLAFGCTNGCLSAIVFQHQANARKTFGGIQMWGSVGWVSAAWLFGYGWLGVMGTGAGSARLGDALRLAALASLVLSGCTLLLPTTPVDRRQQVSLWPREAIGVLLRPRLAFLVGLLFFVFMMFQYYLFGVGPYLRQVHAGAADLLPLMSVAQISEAIALSVLGAVLARLGFRLVLALGLLAHVLRFAVLSLGSGTLPVLVGLAAHGWASAFFFTGCLIYLDAQCDSPAARSGVSQINLLVAYGAGASLGNMLGGQALSAFQAPGLGLVDYRRFWGLPAWVGLVVLAVFVAVFRDKTDRQAGLGLAPLASPLTPPDEAGLS